VSDAPDVRNGLPVGPAVGSVASVFMSRWDAAAAGMSKLRSDGTRSFAEARDDLLKRIESQTAAALSA